MMEMIEYAIGNLSIKSLPITPPEDTASAPATITRAQGKAALIQAGRWSDVEDFVAAIPNENERALANVALNDTLNWQRDSPFLNAAATAIGISGEEMDALFANAATIQL